MTIKTITTATIFFLLLTSCDNKELEQLKKDNAALKTSLDSARTYINKEAEKKKFLGKYLNTHKGLYKSVDFKGETSVVITDGIIGLPFATSYERDGDILRVRTDKSDLMFTVKDSKTLIGEGYAEGTYLKQ